MTRDIKKCFWEVRTGVFHPTLKSALSIGRFNDGSYPYVYRVWLRDGVIIGKYFVHVDGLSICPVKNADKIIERRINNGGSAL